MCACVKGVQPTDDRAVNTGDVYAVLYNECISSIYLDIIISI